jgi:hypothetical protein
MREEYYKNLRAVRYLLVSVCGKYLML